MKKLQLNAAPADLEVGLQVDLHAMTGIVVSEDMGLLADGPADTIERLDNPLEYFVLELSLPHDLGVPIAGYSFFPHGQAGFAKCDAAFTLNLHGVLQSRRRPP